MEESWRGFRSLFTLEAKIASMDFGSQFGVGVAKISRRLQIFVPWGLAGMWNGSPISAHIVVVFC